MKTKIILFLLLGLVTMDVMGQTPIKRQKKTPAKQEQTQNNGKQEKKQKKEKPVKKEQPVKKKNTTRTTNGSPTIRTATDTSTVRTTNGSPTVRTATDTSTVRTTNGSPTTRTATDTSTVRTTNGSPTTRTATDTPTVKTYYANGVSFKMVEVEGGTFTMGATSEQGSDADGDEKPTHRVTLSSYYMGETEVTQALWEAVMGSNPSWFKGSNRPVEYVSWKDCKTFIRKLNSITGKNFRLPTEAEWEYAARGGSKSRGYKYAGGNSIDDVAWYSVYCNNKGLSSPDYGTHPVKGKRPNELGLYDMSGNVREWCSDRYGIYGRHAQTNPTGANSGSNRVYRGGGWDNNARYCRVSFRNNFAPSDRRSDLGFRLALSE